MNTTNHTSPSGEDAANRAIGEREAFEAWWDADGRFGFERTGKDSARSLWDEFLRVTGRAALTAEKVAAEPVAWMRSTDITELTDSEPETSGWIPLYTAPTAALENGDGRDAWISVDERMPENDQIVAFVVKADQESPNWYLNGHVLGGTYHENYGFSTPGVGHRASHWRPLPSPPAALSQKAGEQQ
jgi:hypothetical protein